MRPVQRDTNGFAASSELAMLVVSKVGELAVLFESGSTVRRVGFFRGEKAAEVFAREAGAPLMTVSIDAFESAAVSFRKTRVRHVLALTRNSQIASAVVEAIAVDMVDAFAVQKRATSHPFHNHAMHGFVFVLAVCVNRPGYIPVALALPRKPQQIGISVIYKELPPIAGDGDHASIIGMDERC
jgi:uncharacterized membrane protein